MPPLVRPSPGIARRDTPARHDLPGPGDLLPQTVDEVIPAALVLRMGPSRVHEDHVYPRRLAPLLQLEAQDGRMRRVLRGVADLRVLLPLVEQSDRRVVPRDV